MKENPDNDNYVDFGPQAKQKGRDKETGEEIDLSMDQRYLIPVHHQLRFVTREVPAGEMAGHNVVKNVRILQQYQWCMEKGVFDWYDIPLVEHEDH